MADSWGESLSVIPMLVGKLRRNPVAVRIYSELLQLVEPSVAQAPDSRNFGVKITGMSGSFTASSICEQQNLIANTASRQAQNVMRVPNSIWRAPNKFVPEAFRVWKEGRGNSVVPPI